METGVSYNKLRLHKMGYFAELMSTNEEISESIRPLLRLCREHIDAGDQRLDTCADQFAGTGSAAGRAAEAVEDDPRSRSDHRSDLGAGGGRLLPASTSIKQAISYCGLCSAEKSSADKVMRTPISKQRNKHIQQVLVEAAKLAPRYSHELALLREKETTARERESGHAGGGQEDGGVDAGGGPQATGLRTRRRVQRPKQQRKNLPNKEEQKQDHRCAGCQVPQ